ncbi:MAG TPA: hypothetical protein VM100_09050 [Longimicrobiales bacterium]|nr:hypothetical protein [Longimicrobiales bacterium]
MKTKYSLYLAALALACFATSADARRPSRGGGGTPTNYGCQTLTAGTLVTSPDGSTSKKLLMSSYSCYVCNLSTHVCTLQSPSTLVGWTFIY